MMYKKCISITLLLGFVIVATLAQTATAEQGIKPLNTVVFKDHEVYSSLVNIPINFSMTLQEFACAFINHNISARMDNETNLTITVKDNACFQINTTGSLDLRNNVTMILEGNSSLIINGGALNVSENATLIVKENAKIVINDSARLQINGNSSMSCESITVKNAQLHDLTISRVNQLILKSAEVAGLKISISSLLTGEDSQISGCEFDSVGTFSVSNVPSPPGKSITNTVLKNVENVSVEDVHIDTVTIDNCSNFTAKSQCSANMTKLTISHLSRFVVDGYNVTNLTVHASEVILKNSNIKGNDGELSTLTEAVSFQMSECTVDRSLTFGDNSSVTIVNTTIPHLKATGSANITLFGWYPSKKVEGDKFEAQNLSVQENATVRIYRWLTVYVTSKNNTPIADVTVIVLNSTYSEVARAKTNTAGYAVFSLYSEQVFPGNDTPKPKTVFQGWYAVKVVYGEQNFTSEAIMNDSIEVRFTIETGEEKPQEENMWLVVGIIIVIIVVLLLAYYFFALTKKGEEKPKIEEKEKKKEEWRTDVKPKFKEPPKEWHEKEEK
ncbi:MAG: hypothetical protein QXS83_01490 [Thermoplasmata archaeon]